MWNHWTAKLKRDWNVLWDLSETNKRSRCLWIAYNFNIHSVYSLWFKFISRPLNLQCVLVPRKKRKLFKTWENKSLMPQDLFHNYVSLLTSSSGFVLITTELLVTSPSTEAVIFLFGFHAWSDKRRAWEKKLLKSFRENFRIDFSLLDSIGRFTWSEPVSCFP